jgi:hypothetical protein
MGKISDGIMAVMNLEFCLVVCISLSLIRGILSYSVYAADIRFV